MTNEVNRHLPDRLSAESVEQLHSVLQGDAGRTLVLTGDPDIFCHGIDPDYLLSASDDEVTAVARRFDQCLALIQSYPAPTVAFVEGSALGGGVGLAAACDLVIARSSATFGLPELLFGLVPGVILPYLSSRMSAQAIRRMAYSGIAHTAFEARDSGLVDVCDDATNGHVLRRWLRCLSRLNPEAVVELRSLLRDSGQGPYTEWKERCMSSSLRMQRNKCNVQTLQRFLMEGIPPWEHGQ
jgi:methylglutaconyl-CoA hydratase/polyketide biosynthesis enoyl-CoA hydratase PksH